MMGLDIIFHFHQSCGWSVRTHERARLSDLSWLLKSPIFTRSPQLKTGSQAPKCSFKITFNFPNDDWGTVALMAPSSTLRRSGQEREESPITGRSKRDGRKIHITTTSSNGVWKMSVIRSRSFRLSLLPLGFFLLMLRSGSDNGARFLAPITNKTTYSWARMLVSPNRIVWQT